MTMSNVVSRRTVGLQRAVTWALIVGTGIGLMVLTPQRASAQQVYVGSSNGWRSMRDNPDQWTYVREHVNGFYINFIELLGTSPGDFSALSAEMTHKNAYFESDSRVANLGGFPDGGQFGLPLEGQELNALVNGGFNVRYASLNYGVLATKLSQLKYMDMPPGETRPVFTQLGAWTFGGDINGPGANATADRALIGETAGVSTDGPLGLWVANTGGMHSGSYSLVKYAYAHDQTPVIMMASYALNPLSRWLSIAETDVLQHENAGAVPKIYSVFEYATNTPALPETTANGEPANTTTGMAYWLLYHLHDPAHWAKITPTNAKFVSFHLPSKDGYTLAQWIEFPIHRFANQPQSLTLTIQDSSAWLALDPTLTTKIYGQSKDWSVHFEVGGEDVTPQITSRSGLPFVNSLRLWPNGTNQLQIIFTQTGQRAQGGLFTDRPPTVALIMRPNAANTGATEQFELVHPYWAYPGQR